MYFCTNVFFANIFSEELTWTVEFVDRSRTASVVSTTKLKLLDSLLQEVFIKKALAYYLYSGQKKVHKEKRKYS